MVRCIQHGIDGLKGHKMLRDADAGYYDRSVAACVQEVLFVLSRFKQKNSLKTGIAVDVM